MSLSVRGLVPRRLGSNPEGSPCKEMGPPTPCIPPCIPPCMPCIPPGMPCMPCIPCMPCMPPGMGIPPPCIGPCAAAAVATSCWLTAPPQPGPGSCMSAAGGSVAKGLWPPGTGPAPWPPMPPNGFGASVTPGPMRSRGAPGCCPEPLLLKLPVCPQSWGFEPDMPPPLCICIAPPPTASPPRDGPPSPAASPTGPPARMNVPPTPA
mmetsp:Transcript_12182/g.51289  ORF Transcript_12182/g.51289 Transcript_12182/m.51289 type:complete len:207 (+) Transcript_12182:1457-2077(+)